MQYTAEILKDKKHIHFIGIGGSGMYPLAQILHAKGYYLTGSDNNMTDTLQKVMDMGIPVTLGQKAENVQGADLIVYTAAIMADNPELIAARESGVPVLERKYLLGIVTQQFSNAICISGTHGKTTTTSMATQILMDGGADPTVVIGGKLNSIGGSGRIGRSENMVCESCEFSNTFLELAPDVAVVLNIDEDHMEFFKTLENLKHSFTQFCSMATKCIVYNGDDPNTIDAVKDLPQKKLTFGWRDHNDYYPDNIQQISKVHHRFDLMHKGECLTSIDLLVPGKHNILNAVAACVCGLLAGVPAEKLNLGMKDFHGACRRFEVLYHDHDIVVADDYAHHPAEICATLSAAKELGFTRIIAVHQPFTYSRTARLLDDFAQVLQIADHVVLSEIMGSREKNTIGIYAKDLADKIPGCVWYPTFEEMSDHVLDMVRPGDLVITMGCGDVNKCAHQIVEKLHKKFGD